MHARRSKAKRSSAGAGSPAPASSWRPPRIERVRRLCLGAAAALFVARPLWPSDVATLAGAGLPIALAWMLLLTIWITAGVRDGALAIRWRALDVALLLLVVGFVASGLWAVQHAAARPAVNVVWEWLALASAFWLVRQLIRTPAEVRALVIVMLGLSAAEACYGLHQYFVSLPADRAEYFADPDGALRSAGLWYEPGSRERLLFEQRLASTEPFGTFELANSLGGLLAAWIVAAAAAVSMTAIAYRQIEKASDFWRTLVALAISALPIAATLVLVKSRSAWLATAMGLLGAGAYWLLKSLGSRRRIAWFVGGCFLILVMGVSFGWLTGALDREVISEIPKSFGYRLQYWQTATKIVQDHPWVGAGPGNFRDAYTGHKLPESSEEIADPHNFFCEVAASAGLPAAFALTILIVWAIAIGVRASLRDSIVESQSIAVDGAVRAIIVGAAAGFVVALVMPLFVGSIVGVSLSPARFLAGLMIGGGVVALWWNWIARGAIGPAVPTLAALAMMINLLTAGGIGFPATAGTLWLLLALILALVDLDRSPWIARSPVLIPASLVACALSVICYASAYRPVIAAGAAMAQAAVSPDDADQLLQSAAAADPIDFQPWAQLAMVRFAAWQKTPSAVHWQACDDALRRMLELRPGYSMGWSFAGDCRQAAARQTQDPALWKEAIAAFRRAVELYPEQALRRAKLAAALAETGDRTAAAREAARSLELDQLTPHADQQLSAEMRQAMRRLAGSSGGKPPAASGP